MSAQIIPLRSHDRAVNTPSHQVTAESIAFMADLLNAMARSMAGKRGQHECIDFNATISRTIILCKQIDQLPVTESDLAIMK
jgi:hypothetical protein